MAFIKKLNNRRYKTNYLLRNKIEIKGCWENDVTYNKVFVLYHYCDVLIFKVDFIFRQIVLFNSERSIKL